MSIAAPSPSTAQFTATRAESRTILAIVKRFKAITRDRTPLIELQMDLEATHCNGCPLRLDDLLAADEFNLVHDVDGIRHHMDRDTGRLRGYFLPRYAASQAVES